MLIAPPIGFANDTHFIDILKNQTPFSFQETVGVILPHYKRIDELVLNLHALTHQTYPAHHLEIIIADDGSNFDFSQILNSFSNSFHSIQVITQEDLGFRLSRIRNLGLKASNSSKVVILDCDIIPTPTLIYEHLLVLNVSENVISIGLRQDNANVKTLSDVLSQTTPSFETLDWRVKHIKKGETFLNLSNSIWKLCSGGNLAFHKSILDLAMFDESFTFWGGEDNEWAYRLSKKGAYFYLNTSALAYHANLTEISYNKSEHKSTAIHHTRQRCPSFDTLAHNLTDWHAPLLTFWITNYNKAPYVETALASLKGCAFSHEILVVDNQSTDNSIEVLSAYPHIRLVHEHQRGAYFAYERALKEAKGEFAIQLDADDTLDMAFVNDQITFLLENPFGLLYGLVQPCDAQLIPLGNTPIWNPSSKTRCQNILSSMNIRCPRISRMRDISRTPSRPFVQSAVDFNLYSKLLFNTHSKCVENVAYHYRQTPLSITSTELDSQKRNTIFVIEHNRSLLKNSHLFQEHERKDRKITYYDNNPLCYFLDHLKLTPHALSTFEQNPNPLRLVSNATLHFFNTHP